MPATPQAVWRVLQQARLDGAAEERPVTGLQD
jgi:hypothetical protein